MTPIARPSASGLGKAFELGWPRPEERSKPPHVQRAAAKGHRIHAGLFQASLGAKDGDIYSCVTPEEEGELRQALGIYRPLAPIDPRWDTYEAERWLDPVKGTALRGIRAQCHHENPTPPPPGFYRGTADEIGRNPEGRLAVRDHKTGYPPIQTPPAFSAQFYFFALWLALHPWTAEEVARDGVSLEMFLTQWAPFGLERALVTHHADPASIQAFRQIFTEFELGLRAKEAE